MARGGTELTLCATGAKSHDFFLFAFDSAGQIGTPSAGRIVRLRAALGA
jgi:hypothetical protein